MSQENHLYYLLHTGLYAKDFNPVAVTETPKGYFYQEVTDLYDASLFTDLKVAEAIRKDAMKDGFGTNWYDSDVVIVTMRGKVDFVSNGGEIEWEDLKPINHDQTIYQLNLK